MALFRLAANAAAVGAGLKQEGGFETRPYWNTPPKTENKV